MIKTSFNKNFSMTSGFTLIETLIVMFISSIVLGAIFTSFFNQQKAYVTNNRLVKMQQNLRAAIIIISRELREAGCDPTGNANAGIVLATQGRLQFTKDLDNNGNTEGTHENITFGFSSNNDFDKNGIADSGSAGTDWSTPANLKRDTGGGFMAIAENIEAVEFNYILSNDTTTTAPTSSQLNEIRAVQISILARASSIEQNFDTKNITYTTASGTVWTRPNDRYRRRFVSTTIQCRNLGY